LAASRFVFAMETAMRVYQVLVIGSFVALAACSGADTSDGVAAPANDVSATPGVGGETSTTMPRSEADAPTGKQDDAVDENGRPIGATDPIRTPTP
jgi:hypothetical protein